MKSKKSLDIKDIERIFSNRTPGAEEGFKFFSVLVPVIVCKDKLKLLYEVRAKHMVRQPGEICFPGGELEENEDTKECALRETYEETGIQCEKIKIVNQLDTIYTYSNFVMYCYLGIIEEEALEDLNPNPDEVDEIFCVELNELMDTEPEIYTVKTVPKPPEDFPYDRVTGGDSYKWRGGQAQVPVYDVDGRVIWGLTARITKRFIDVIRERDEKDV